MLPCIGNNEKWLEKSYHYWHPKELLSALSFLPTLMWVAFFNHAIRYRVFLKTSGEFLEKVDTEWGRYQGSRNVALLFLEENVAFIFLLLHKLVLRGRIMLFAITFQLLFSCLQLLSSRPCNLFSFIMKSLLFSMLFSSTSFQVRILSL